MYCPDPYALMSPWSVHHTGRAGWKSRQHRHWWHNGLQKWEWLVSSWERVHFPILPLWSAARTVDHRHLGPDDRDVQTSKLLRPHRRSHAGNWSRCSCYVSASATVSKLQTETKPAFGFRISLLLRDLFSIQWLNLSCFVWQHAFQDLICLRSFVQVFIWAHSCGNIRLGPELLSWLQWWSPLCLKATAWCSGIIWREVGSVNSVFTFKALTSLGNL